MYTLDIFGGTTQTVHVTAATPLAASASTSPAVDVRNYDGQMIGVLNASSATGTQTLFVEFMTCTSATNSAATQLTTRRYFTTVANTANAPQIIQVPVADCHKGFLKARMTVSAASVYRTTIQTFGRKTRQE